jgi:hypothetical protein
VKFRSIFYSTSLLLLISLLPACTGRNDENITENQSTIQKLMELMPATAMQDTQDVIYFNDYAKIRKVYGISLPVSYSEQDLTTYYNAMHSWATGMADVSSFMSGYNRMYLLQNPVKPENIGYGIKNVDALLYHGYNVSTGIPQEWTEVISGSFSPSTTKEKFSKQENWPETAKTLFTTEIYNNVTVYSWGNGNEMHVTDHLSPPCFDNLGRIRPFALTKNNVFVSDSVETVKLMIDINSGKISGLTGLRQYADIATGLTELGIYSAVIVQDTFKDEQLQRDDISQSLLLKKYLACSTGIGKDEKGTYMVIVMDNPDASTASDNVKILQTRIENVSYIEQNITIKWKDNVNEFQVYAKGNLVISKLYTDKLGIWRDVIFAHPLLQHE